MLESEAYSCQSAHGCRFNPNTVPPHLDRREHHLPKSIGRNCYMATCDFWNDLHTNSQGIHRLSNSLLWLELPSP
jgi:hypothetical protein